MKIIIAELAKIEKKVAFWVDSKELYKQLKQGGVNMCKWQGITLYTNQHTYCGNRDLEESVLYAERQNYPFYEIENTYYEIY